MLTVSGISKLFKTAFKCAGSTAFKSFALPINNKESVGLRVISLIDFTKVIAALRRPAFYIMNNRNSFKKYKLIERFKDSPWRISIRTLYNL